MNAASPSTACKPPRDLPGAAFLFRAVEGIRRRPECLLYALLLLALNIPGQWTEGPRRFGFHVDAVARGEVWRVFTHPFAHVSAYHLALDGLAFLGLAGMLDARRAFSRIGLAAGCALGALLGALVHGPLAPGYTGLSGAAHGLCALVCADLWRRGVPEAGWGLVLLLGKCAAELLGGGVLLAGLHAGDVGIPVVASHAGGALAGLALAGWRDGRRKRKSQSDVK